MNRDEVEQYLARWYPRDPQNTSAPMRFHGVVDDIVDGCRGYTVMHTDRTGTPCTTFVPADAETTHLDDIMTGAQ